MDGMRALPALCFALAAIGCNAPPTPPFPDWTHSSGPQPATAGAENLAQAARDAERICASDLDRVYFTPGRRAKIVQALQGPLSRVCSLGTEDVALQSRVARPFEPLPLQRGWWLLGQALAWRIEASVRGAKWDEAISDAVAATRFGLALGSGSATDAALGLAIVDRARQSILPGIANMGAGELGKLADGLRAAHDARPPLAAVVENEHAAMLAAVQETQDAYRENRLASLSEKLGRDVGPAIAYLEGMRRSDVRKRPDYFEGFAEEAEEVARCWSRCATLNAKQRANGPKPKLASERPWRRFARHFFGSVDPLFPLRDTTLARTRLLILHSLVLRHIKVRGAAPASLAEFPESVAVDPYTGELLVYRSEGIEFRLYSVGENLKDDGGETDQEFQFPDLRLETELL